MSRGPDPALNTNVQRLFLKGKKQFVIKQFMPKAMGHFFEGRSFVFGKTNRVLVRENMLAERLSLTC